MKDSGKKRIVGFDIIRLIACFFVLLVHFNAAVSGYDNGIFKYPNSVLPGFIVENRIYLGTLGVVMFFMLSGASLMLTYKPEEGVAKFYSKRILSIYPSFWIAFAIATVVDFFCYHGIAITNPWNLTISFAGLDGYFWSMNLIPGEYYKLGEWFLGCIILLYLLFPLIYSVLNQYPIPCGIIAAAIYAAGLYCIKYQVPCFNASTSFLLCLPEMILGMLYVRFSMHIHKRPMLIIATAVFFLALILRAYIPSDLLTLITAVFLFSLIIAATDLIKNPAVGTLLQKASAQTYSIFLVHHWIVYKLIQGFDLATMPRMYVWILFAVYLVLSMVLACLLTKAGSCLAGKIKNKRSVLAVIMILLVFSYIYTGCSVLKYV